MSLQTASFVPVLSPPHTVITHFHVMFFQYHNFDHSFCCYWLSCMTNFSDDWILKCLKKCIYVKMLCPPMEKKMRVCVGGGHHFGALWHHYTCVEKKLSFTLLAFSIFVLQDKRQRTTQGQQKNKNREAESKLTFVIRCCVDLVCVCICPMLSDWKKSVR